jgi:hypothetical protein
VAEENTIECEANGEQFQPPAWAAVRGAKRFTEESWLALTGKLSTFSPLSDCYRFKPKRAALGYGRCAVTVVPWDWEGTDTEADPLPAIGRDTFGKLWSEAQRVELVPLGKLVVWASRRAPRRDPHSERSGCKLDPKVGDPLYAEHDPQCVMGQVVNRVWILELLRWPIENLKGHELVTLALGKHPEESDVNILGMRLQWQGCGAPWDAFLVGMRPGPDCHPGDDPLVP